MGKVPANAKESLTVRVLPNEGVAAQAVSPGRVPGSSAVYEKQIDATGKTIQYTKTMNRPGFHGNSIFSDLGASMKTGAVQLHSNSTKSRH
jgi:hypothetical protein